MRGAVLSIVLVIASCAPDYAHTSFRCRNDPDCPAGQICRAERCRRGELTGDGVVCGDMTCALDAQCCDDGVRHCQAAGAVCHGVSELCDGTEDCPVHGLDHDYCCADNEMHLCDATCSHAMCRVDGDCPRTAPNCCDANAATMTPGLCSQFSCPSPDD
ncbi:MAG TPA: hypothetical protein VFK02_14555 [Kofleriaceae bacterium]|nr:hypothetical protein [Kofleriaceae bacterium]